MLGANNASCSVQDLGLLESLANTPLWLWIT